VPFRVFGCAAQPPASPPGAVLLWNWLLVQSLTAELVSPSWVRRSRCAVRRFVGCAVFPSSASPAAVRLPTDPLCEFHLPLEYCPAKPSRPAAAGRLLSWTSRSLQHIRNRRSTGRGRYLPATLRPQSLATLSAPYSRRIRAGFLSHRRRSWDSPFGAFPHARLPRSFGLGRTHVPFRPASTLTAEAESRPCKPAVPGFRPLRESLRDRRVFSAPAAGCSRGFCPFKVRPHEPARDFARTPPTRFAARLQADEQEPAPRSLDRLMPGSPSRAADVPQPLVERPS
jgi:hypothetical protein